MSTDKKFHFTADIVFEAKDIDDAINKLGDHFHALNDDDPIQSIEHTGTMQIEPY
jgi:hypothetical protein